MGCTTTHLAHIKLFQHATQAKLAHPKPHGDLRTNGLLNPPSIAHMDPLCYRAKTMKSEEYVHIQAETLSIYYSYCFNTL